MENLKNNNINKVVSGAVALGAALGTFNNANGEEINKTTSSPDAKTIQIEQTSTLAKEGFYKDTTKEKREELAKVEKSLKENVTEINQLTNEIIRQTKGGIDNNKELIDILLIKFPNIEMAHDILRNLLTAIQEKDNNYLLTYFQDIDNSFFNRLDRLIDKNVNLSKEVTNKKSELEEEIRKIICLADCNSLEPTFVMGVTDEKDQPSKQPYKESFGQKVGNVLDKAGEIIANSVKMDNCDCRKDITR